MVRKILKVMAAALGTFAICFEPAMAETTEEQFVAAAKLFSPFGGLEGSYKAHKIIMSGAEGRWVRLLDGEKEMDRETLLKYCNNSGLNLAVSDYQFRLTADYKKKDGSAGRFETIYTDKGHGVYGFISDPDGIFGRYGFTNDDESVLSLRSELLSNFSGTAHVFRTSPDVIVTLTIGEYAQFLLRCP